MLGEDVEEEEEGDDKEERMSKEQRKKIINLKEYSGGEWKDSLGMG